MASMAMKAAACSALSPTLPAHNVKSSIGHPKVSFVHLFLIKKSVLYFVFCEGLCSGHCMREDGLVSEIDLLFLMMLEG